MNKLELAPVEQAESFFVPNQQTLGAIFDELGMPSRAANDLELAYLATQSWVS